MTVKLDKVQDAQVRQDYQGVEATRRARITGIQGTPNRRQRAALEAAGLPRYGDPHPAWPELRLVEINLAPVDVSQWDATLIYRHPSPEEKREFKPLGSVVDRSWFATTVTEEVNFDIRGGTLWHYYTGFPIQPKLINGRFVGFGPTAARQLAIKNDRATVQKPSVGVRITITEAESIQRRLEYIGTINAAPWAGYPAKTWMLGGVDSRKDTGRWQNIYTVYYNRDTWRFKSTVDWAGTVPSDVTEGNGIALFDVYPESNWALLGFSL